MSFRTLLQLWSGAWKHVYSKLPWNVVGLDVLVRLACAELMAYHLLNAITQLVCMRRLLEVLPEHATGCRALTDSSTRANSSHGRLQSKWLSVELLVWS